MSSTPPIKVAIAAFIGGSYFGGSQPVAILNLAEALTDAGYAVTLLHVGESAEVPLMRDPQFDDCHAFAKQWPTAGLHTACRAGLQFDLLIDLVGVIGGDMLRSLAKSAIFFARDYGILREIDMCVYPMTALRRSYTQYDEIWVWDTVSAADIAMWATLCGGRPVRQIPFFWSPAPILAHMDGQAAQVHPAATSAAHKWTIRICETNTRNSSSAVLPLLIAAEVVRQKVANVEAIIVHNSDHINDNKFFKENVFAHATAPGVQYSFVGRQRICDMSVLPQQVILAHNRFIAGKYAHLDAAWSGIPTIHNSLWLKSLGGAWERLYYEDNSIRGAVDAFRCLPDAAAEIAGTLEDTRARILETFGIARATVRDELVAAVGAVAAVAAVAAVPPTQVPTQSPNRLLGNGAGTEAAEAGAQAEAAKPITIGFAFMWENFQPDYNFFTLLLDATLASRGDPRRIHGLSVEALQAAGQRPDLVIYGPFGEPGATEPFPGVPKVFHTAEWVPLPINGGPDTFLQLGFTREGEIASNQVMRLPLWMMSIDWWGSHPHPEAGKGVDNDRLVNPKLIPLRRCTEVDRAEWARKKKFCAFIVTNPMNPVRNDAYHSLTAYKTVDSAGRLFNTTGPGLFAGLGGGGGELRKHEFLKDYRFCLAYENQRGPGYVTEKLLHAKAAGAVPIYWGAEDVGDDFNMRGIINANYLDDGGKGLVEAVRIVEEGMSGDDADPGRAGGAIWEAMAAEPLLLPAHVEAARRQMAAVADRILGGISRIRARA